MTDATAPTADVTSGSPQTNYYSGSTLFHMQIANPVSGGTPSYDGFWTLVEPTVTKSSITDSSITMYHDTQSASISYPFDLTPASDYDLTADSANGSCTGTANSSGGQWAWENSDVTEKCLT